MRSSLKHICCAVATVLLAHVSHAQNSSSSNDDPARWTQEDVTLQEQYATSRKELAAAYKMAVDACNSSVASDKKAQCLADAKSDYEQELSLLGFRLGPSR